MWFGWGWPQHPLPKVDQWASALRRFSRTAGKIAFLFPVVFEAGELKRATTAWKGCQHQSLQVEADSYRHLSSWFQLCLKLIKLLGSPILIQIFFFLDLKKLKQAIREKAGSTWAPQGISLANFWEDSCWIPFSWLPRSCPSIQSSTSLEGSIFHTDDNEPLVSHETNLMGYGQHFFKWNKIEGIENIRVYCML